MLHKYGNKSTIYTLIVPTQSTTIESIKQYACLQFCCLFSKYGMITILMYSSVFFSLDQWLAKILLILRELVS